MALEIERKFLVNGDAYKSMAESNTDIMQGYLSRDPEATVRVRISGNKAWLTVKSKNHGAVRHEWEYEVPVAEAKEMMSICKGILSKTRYIVYFGGHKWEVDVFHGNHEGLVTAEVEITDESACVDIPQFVGKEVTGDPTYYNSNL